MCWHMLRSMTPRRREAEINLEAIVDKPLKGSLKAESVNRHCSCNGSHWPYQSTDHSDPNRETIPQSCEANVAINPAHRFSCTFTGCVRKS